jgi:hypothetical protein
MFVKISQKEIVNISIYKSVYLSAECLCFHGDAHNFETLENAEKAFNLICEALSQGKTYLDLTKHIP